MWIAVIIETRNKCEDVAEVDPTVQEHQGDDANLKKEIILKIIVDNKRIVWIQSSK